MTLTPKQKKILAMVPVMAMVYLASTLILYDLVLEPEVDRLTGMVAARVNITQSALSICNFPLYEGKNMISFHCINGMFPLDFMLANYTADYDYVFTYRKNDADDPWKSYNTNLPSVYVQDLSFIHDYESYWIFLNKNTTYYLEGFFNTNSQTQLLSGWNFVGYPRENMVAPAAAFSSLDGNYDMVLHYKAENNTWYYYQPGNSSSTLAVIEPDSGYWIHMTADDVWVYP